MGGESMNRAQSPRVAVRIRGAISAIVYAACRWTHRLPQRERCAAPVTGCGLTRESNFPSRVLLCIRLRNKIPSLPLSNNISPRAQTRGASNVRVVASNRTRFNTIFSNSEIRELILKYTRSNRYSSTGVIIFECGKIHR